MFVSYNACSEILLGAPSCNPDPCSQYFPAAVKPVTLADV